MFFTEKLMGALHHSFTAAVTHAQPLKANTSDHSCAAIISLPSVVQVNFLLCDELSHEVSVTAVVLAKVVLGEELTTAVPNKAKESHQNWDNRQNDHGMVQEGEH